jgi:hypothetical protein
VRHAIAVERQLASLDSLETELGQVARHRQPGAGSTSSTEMPACRGFAAGSVLHKSAISPDRRALEIQVFDPLTTRSEPPDPVGTAVVEIF